MAARNISFKIIVLFFVCFSVHLLDACVKPDYVSDEEWEKVKPYFLPEDHPAKPILDEIFSFSRAILSLKSMEEAGFIDPKPRKWTHVVVCKHRDLDGYIIKTYLDAQRHFKRMPDYEHWLKRIHGVEQINEVIQKYEYSHYFKCPKKWIYPLPERPSPPEELLRKNYILFEEDMDILSDQECKEMWKSPAVTIDFLNAFFVVLKEVGLNDCAKPDNAPFSNDGRVAFIDTESYDQWPVRYNKLTPFLSSEMKIFWKKLTN